MSAEDIMDWCRPRLAGYKRPPSIAFLTSGEIPRTVRSKIQHARIRAALRESVSP
jgi:acyl-CoA synthetase (AMP-forming)/AMP-acid ligase II